MIVSLRVAAIAGLMAVASTPVMAQTTETLPAQPPPYGVAPPPSQPPTANQSAWLWFTSNSRKTSLQLRCSAEPSNRNQGSAGLWKTGTTRNFTAV
jgi:hypothetical protein